jgi:hypothetical protein
MQSSLRLRGARKVERRRGSDPYFEMRGGMRGEEYI